MSCIELHLTWEQIDHLESAFFYHIIDLGEVGVGPMHIPEGEAHDDGEVWSFRVFEFWSIRDRVEKASNPSEKIGIE